jgi:hypothetical protein
MLDVGAGRPPPAARVVPPSAYYERALERPAASIAVTKAAASNVKPYLRDQIREAGGSGPGRWRWEEPEPLWDDSPERAA